MSAPRLTPARDPLPYRDVSDTFDHSGARELGEEFKARLGLMGHRVALFDNDPESENHDPKYGAHLIGHSETRTVIVELPHMATNGLCCLGEWIDDGGGRGERRLGWRDVVAFVAENLRRDDEMTCEQPHFGAHCTLPAGHGGDHYSIEPNGCTATYPKRPHRRQA